ncbi:tRNA/rRNA methyltransferase [Pseudaeromonas sp. ZJS20]|uniref:tRNA/rRNA methyltransferase n=1 Tax=Pseudaeromonas aegiceratis TaxID=3153928 RepID=UPI00390C8308
MDIYFVLMSPARAENVGAAARAMKTMGFSRLRIVNSMVHQEAAAGWVAHGAQEILATAEHFVDLPSALADMDLVVATTARRRGQQQVYLTADELKEQLQGKPDLRRVAILFGCEESGLSNEQLAQADLVSYLPLKVDYPSLNLGQAIMLYAYELSRLELPAAAPSEEIPVETQVRALKQRIHGLFGDLAISPDEKLARWVMSGVPMLKQRDLNLLHLLCKDLERALRGQES